MAQVVKLKRTSVQGRIPTISNLELGELAINTHDGRIFFQKDDGTLSIQEILTTNSDNSGSFNLQGAISASSLSISGDTTIGGNLTLGGNITIGDSDTDSVSFSSDISSSFLPDSNLEFDLGSDIKKWNNLYVGTASADFFVGDGSGLTNLLVDVGETATVTSSFDNQSTISVIHSFDSKNILVSVYDTNYSQLIPQSVTLTDNDTVDIVLSSTGSGHVVVAKGGHILSGSAFDSQRLGGSLYTTYATTGSNLFVGPQEITGSLNLTGVVSASAFSGDGSGLILDLSSVSQSIIPIDDNVFDLGSPTNQWRDLYLSSASLYIDGTKVLSSTTETLTFTTDNGQNIKLLEGGTDNITLQTEDGDIEIKSSGGGNVLLDPTNGLVDVRGTLQIQDGQKITSSGANSIIFGDNIEITGSLSLSGDINGNVNSTNGVVSGSEQVILSDVTGFTEFSSSISSSFDGLSSNYVDLIGIPSGIISSSNQLDSENLNVGIVTGSDILSTGNVFAGGYIQSEDGLYVGANGQQTQFSVNETGNTVIRGTLDIGSAVGGISDVSSSIAANVASITSHVGRSDNPHSVTKAQVGLEHVENIALSTYTGQGGALDNQYITNGAGYITSFTDTQLSNEQVQDIVGAMVSSNTESGITVTYQDADGTIDFSVASQTDNNFTNALKTKLDGIATGAEVNTVDSVAGKTGVVTLVKEDVGLGDVDDTSDADKPISTLTQAALDGKLDTTHDFSITLTGDVTGTGTVTNMGNVSFTTTVADDSHNHTIANVDGLQNALDGKQSAGSYVTTTSAQSLSSAANALTFAGNVLTLTRGDGSTDTINLSAYLDDTNLARVISGTYNSGSQELVFTRDDASTFTIDASMFFDDTNLVTSVNAGSGISVNQTTGGITVTNTAPNVSTNLSTTANSTSLTINSSDGTNASIPAATTSAWGAMTDEDKIKLTTIQYDANYVSDENIEDVVGGMLDGNTQTGITVTYQDADGTIDFEVASQTDNNFTNALKTKLDGIAASANNYVHPNYAGDDINIDTGVLTGATVISDLDFNITTDTNGHVSDANGTFSTRTLTLSDLGYTGDTNANNYVHPSYAGDDINVDTGALTGATVVSDIDFNITTDTLGHVTDANGVVSTRTLTLSDLGYSGATNANYITNNNQLTNGAGYITSFDITTQTDSKYLRSDTSDTMNGALEIYSSGSTVLDIQGSQGQLFSVTDDLTGTLFAVSDISGIPILEVDASGTVTVDGELNVTGDVIAYASSDERLKENITPIENATDKVKQIGGYTFDWKSDIENITSRSGNDIGLIAQEVEKVVPQVVTTRTNGYKGIDYQKLVALLIESNKELALRIEELEKKLQ